MTNTITTAANDDAPENSIVPIGPLEHTVKLTLRQMRRQPDGTWIEGDFPLSAFEEEQA